MRQTSTIPSPSRNYGGGDRPCLNFPVGLLLADPILAIAASRQTNQQCFHQKPCRAGFVHLVMDHLSLPSQTCKLLHCWCSFPLSPARSCTFSRRCTRLDLFRPPPRTLSLYDSLTGRFPLKAHLNMTWKKYSVFVHLLESFAQHPKGTHLLESISDHPRYGSTPTRPRFSLSRATRQHQLV